MAEAVRFELTEGYQPSTVFKTVALNRSATPPNIVINYINLFHILSNIFNLILFTLYKIFIYNKINVIEFNLII